MGWGSDPNLTAVGRHFSLDRGSQREEVRFTGATGCKMEPGRANLGGAGAADGTQTHVRGCPRQSDKPGRNTLVSPFPALLSRLCLPPIRQWEACVSGPTLELSFPNSWGRHSDWPDLAWPHPISYGQGGGVTWLPNPGAPCVGSHSPWTCELGRLSKFCVEMQKILKCSVSFEL